MSVRFAPMLRPCAAIVALVQPARRMVEPLSPEAEDEMRALFDRHLAKRFNGIPVARGWERRGPAAAPVLGSVTFTNKGGDVVLRIDFDLALYRLRDWLADRLEYGSAKPRRQHTPETQWRCGGVGHPTRLRTISKESL